MQIEESESERIHALIAFAAWCCSSERNQVGTISGKLTAVQFFHRRDAGIELPISSSLIKRALRGMANSHIVAGTPRRVRLPISWDVLLAGRCLIPSWGVGGRVLWMCLALGYFLAARSDEIFASDAGIAHPIHCLTRRDVAFFSGPQQLTFLQRHRATHVEFRFRGHKGDQAQKGSIIVRTREEVTGPHSGVGTGGGAVALMVELMSLGITLPESAPLSSYTCGSVVRVWRYGQALRALRQVVVQSGGEPSDFALHSLRIGAATKLAAGGDVPDRVIQREGRWARDSNTFKIYTQGNTVDSRKVSKKLAQVGKAVPRQPGQGTVWNQT